MKKANINENRVNRIISESIKKVLNESVDVVSKVKELVDAANKAYIDAFETCGLFPLIDKEGDSYGLKDEIVFSRGRVIIMYSDVYNKHMNMNVKVLAKQGGEVKLIKGDYMTEGWNDIKKALTQIINDAERGKQHMQNYDPRWEEAETPEEFSANKEKMKGFNKSVGMRANTGIDQISKKY